MNAFATPSGGRSSSAFFDSRGAEDVIAQRRAQLEGQAQRSASVAMSSTPPRVAVPRVTLEQAFDAETYGDECVAMSALRDAERTVTIPLVENAGSPLPEQQMQPRTCRARSTGCPRWRAVMPGCVAPVADKPLAKRARASRSPRVARGWCATSVHAWPQR